MRRDLALDAFRQLPIDKQRLCRAAVPLFNALQDKFKRTTTPNFHLWIKTKGFDEFPDARLDPPAPERHWVCGDELTALALAMRMAGRGMPRTAEHPEHGVGLWRTGSFPPDLAALRMFAGDDPAAFAVVDVGSKQFAAWRDRLQAWLGGEVTGEKRWTEEHNPAVHDLSPSNPNFKFRKSTYSLRIPAPWPPHSDGTWWSATDEGKRA